MASIGTREKKRVGNKLTRLLKMNGKYMIDSIICLIVE